MPDAQVGGSAAQACRHGGPRVAPSAPRAEAGAAAQRDWSAACSCLIHTVSPTGDHDVPNVLEKFLAPTDISFSLWLQKMCVPKHIVVMAGEMLCCLVARLSFVGILRYTLSHVWREKLGFGDEL